MTALEKTRCSWAQADNLLISYHDKQWGVPVHNDRLLFEMLNLEGAQAGLSWLTILKKRKNYKTAFDDFDAKKIVNYSEKKRAELLADAGIVRNRLKINAVIENAQAFLATQRQHGSFDAYIWSFVKNKALINPDKQTAATVSEAMSKDMKRRGFKFVGPTICYGFMQAVGLVNDHSSDCFRVNAV